MPGKISRALTKTCHITCPAGSSLYDASGLCLECADAVNHKILNNNIFEKYFIYIKCEECTGSSSTQCT